MTRTTKGLLALLTVGLLLATTAPAMALTKEIGATPRSSDDLTSSIDLARLLARAQAGQLGLPWAETVAAPVHAGPAEALLALAERSGASPTDAQAARIRALDGLAEPLRGALARHVDAFLALDAAAREAYADVDLAGIQAILDGAAPQDATLAGLGLDLAPVFPARDAFLATIPPLRASLAVSASAVACPPLVVAPAFALDLAGCDATYVDDVILLVDAGGEDAYLNNAGGSAGSPTDHESCYVGEDENGDIHYALFAAALVDLGGDDDVYGDAAMPRACGINGGGALGVGLLVDDGGDEAYHATFIGTNGGGNFGLGFLLDAGGDDAYEATRYSGNGGGNFGAGLLLDAEGVDEYVAGDYAVNGGGSPFGPRPEVGFTSVGVGLLYDGGGSGDAYVDADPACSGSGTDRTVAPKCAYGAQVDA